MTPPVIAEVTRHDGHVHRVESQHRGHVVLVGPDGPELVLGDADLQFYPRSTVKPFQATACLELLAEHGPVAPGGLSSMEVAVAWASHRGERRHLDAVRQLLDRSGTVEDGLTCPPALPDADTVWPPASPGTPPSRLRHNCSGKHALFALAGQGIGMRGPALLDADRPLQQAVLAVLGDACGELHGLGTDGCGAPAVVTSLTGLATGYRRLVAEDRWQVVRDAGLAHPGLVGGTGRVETALLAAGVVAKVGAEGVYAASWHEDDRAYGIAVKAEDGSTRGGAVALVAILADRGVVPHDVWSPPAVTGGGDVVGTVRAATTITG